MPAFTQLKLGRQTNASRSVNTVYLARWCGSQLHKTGCFQIFVVPQRLDSCTVASRKIVPTCKSVMKCTDIHCAGASS
jgi:hypothetical protein